MGFFKKIKRIILVTMSLVIFSVIYLNVSLVIVNKASKTSRSPFLEPQDELDHILLDQERKNEIAMLAGRKKIIEFESDLNINENEEESAFSYLKKGEEILINDQILADRFKTKIRKRRKQNPQTQTKRRQVGAAKSKPLHLIEENGSNFNIPGADTNFLDVDPQQNQIHQKGIPIQDLKQDQNILHHGMLQQQITIHQHGMNQAQTGVNTRNGQLPFPQTATTKVNTTNIMRPSLFSDQPSPQKVPVAPPQQGEKESAYVRALNSVLRFSALKCCKTLLRKTLHLMSYKAQNNIATTEIRDHLPNNVKLYHTKKWNGLPLPVLTSQPIGRLGNVMGEYATLYAISLLYGATGIVHPGMKKTLSGFPQLSLQESPVSEFDDFLTVRQSGSGDMYDYKSYHVAASGLLGAECFIFKEYPFEMELFLRYKDELKKEFTFSEKVQNRTSRYLRTVKKIVKNDTRTDIKPPFTFVGIHVRRTDYAKHVKNFGSRLPGPEYIFKAMDYMKEKYDNVIFIASSDDKKYLEEHFLNLTNFFISEGKSRLEDMAILASCNQSIMTQGTYGFFSSFLAGGEVVYPDIESEKPYRFTRPFYEAANLTYFTPIIA